MACRVAPRKLSKMLPAIPEIALISGSVASDLRSPCSIQKQRPSENAPRKEAAIPRALMPPDVPGATHFPVVIRRGGDELSTPSSVAQVSALAAASAPVKPIFNSRRARVED